MKVFEIKINHSGKKKVYMCGVKLFSYKSKLRITKQEENNLKEIEKQFPQIMTFQEMIEKIKKGGQSCQIW